MTHMTHNLTADDLSRARSMIVASDYERGWKRMVRSWVAGSIEYHNIIAAVLESHSVFTTAIGSHSCAPFWLHVKKLRHGSLCSEVFCQALAAGEVYIFLLQRSPTWNLSFSSSLQVVCVPPPPLIFNTDLKLLSTGISHSSEE